MMTMLANEGRWVETKERQPEARGRYRVVIGKYRQQADAEYLWNGSYWVTPKGSPSDSVQAWMEQTDAALPAGRGPAMPEKALTIADYEARIHLYKEQIGIGYIGIGRTLNEAKAAQVVPHGQWEDWVTRTTGLTPRQAQRCMQAATEIRDGSAVARLEMSKALMLLGSGLDEDAQEKIAEKAAEEGATVKALKEEIRQAKLKLVQETGAALEAQLQATIEAYRKQIDQAEGDAYRRGMSDQAEGLETEIRRKFQDDLDRMDRERLKAQEKVRELQEQLKISQGDVDRCWNDGYESGKKEAEARSRTADDQRAREIKDLEKELNDLDSALDLTEKELAGARDEANKQRQYAEELRRNQADLLAAAEEAEKRAADAVAELEMLRAGQDPAKAPAQMILNRALSAFYGECELMPWNPGELQDGRQPILEAVAGLEAWCERMRAALDAAVPAEGAVL